MELCLAAVHLLHESGIALAVIAQERLAVFEHGFGRLPGIVEGVIHLAEVVLQDTDPGAELRQCLAIVAVRQTKGPGGQLGQHDCLLVGCVYRGEPLAEQRDLAAGLQRGKVSLKLLSQQSQGLLAAGSFQQDEHIIPTAVLRNIGQVFHNRALLVKCEPGENAPKYTALAEAAAHVTGIEQDLHGEIRVLCIRFQKSAADLLIISMAQGSDGGKKIQAVLPAGAAGDGAVFGFGFVCKFLQDFQHGKDLLYK